MKVRGSMPLNAIVAGAADNWFAGAVIDRDADIASEQVIVGSRVALAVGGLVATYLDPTQPSQGAIGYAFLAGYVVFSLILLATFYRPLRDYWSVIAHGTEITLVCLIIINTEGPSSPFFIYFTFLLFAATLRWQGRGALITGALLSAVLMVLTTSTFLVHFQDADVDRLILRNIYLIVASGLFASLGDQLGRSHQRLERLRHVRELHDGVLQSLTAVGLKLHTVASIAQGDQRRRLLEIGRLLANEQRQIRDFVEKSRQDQRFNRQQDGAFAIADLRPFVGDLKRLWDCNIGIVLSPADAEIPVTLGGALKFILAESVANAVVHGGATHVTTVITQDRRSVLLKIKDNGSGLLDADAEYDHARLVTDDVGPRSIRDRVTHLRGTLRLQTSAKGVELQIELPIRGAL